MPVREKNWKIYLRNLWKRLKTIFYIKLELKLYVRNYWLTLSLKIPALAHAGMW
jgi:hypothetical protein